MDSGMPGGPGGIQGRQTLMTGFPNGPGANRLVHQPLNGGMTDETSRVHQLLNDFDEDPNNKVGYSQSQKLIEAAATRVGTPVFIVGNYQVSIIRDFEAWFFKTKPHFREETIQLLLVGKPEACDGQ